MKIEMRNNGKKRSEKMEKRRKGKKKRMDDNEKKGFKIACPSFPYTATALSLSVQAGLIMKSTLVIPPLSPSLLLFFFCYCCFALYLF